MQGGQYGGYLFPMGPFFALGRADRPEPVARAAAVARAGARARGVGDGAADGRASPGRPRGAAHLVAGLLFLLNPYVAVFTARTSVTLLGYAALPWLLLCVLPRAARAALVVVAGRVRARGRLHGRRRQRGGHRVGAARPAAARRLRARDPHRRRCAALLAFGWRTVLLTGLGAVWWVIPTLVQARHGVDFLRFTEQPGTIWSTTSLPESLRLMGYWISYLGVGYGGRLRPLFGDGAVLLFAWPVVIAGLLVPALVLSGFALVRRSRARRVPAGAGAGGAAGDGGRLPRGDAAAAGDELHLQPRRAAAVPAHDLQGGAAARARAGRPGRARGRPRGAVAARPRPRAAGRRAGGARRARRGRRAGRSCAGRRWTPSSPGRRSRRPGPRRPTTSTRRRGRTAARSCCPGQLYADYDWGGTVDAILPALAERPGRRALRGALRRPARGRPAVDGRRARPAAPRAARPARPAAGPAVRAHRGGRAPTTTAPAAARSAPPTPPTCSTSSARPTRRGARCAASRARRARSGAPRPLPRVRAWDRPGARPMVRLEADAGATVVDGSADALAGLAALGALPGGPDRLRGRRERGRGAPRRPRS